MLETAIELNKVKRKYTLEERRDYIERWKKSGLSYNNFCRAEGIKPQTFWHWIKPAKPKQKKQSSIGFTPIKLNSLHLSNEADIEIYLPNGLRCCFNKFSHVGLLVDIVKELSHVTHD